VDGLYFFSQRPVVSIHDTDTGPKSVPGYKTFIKLFIINNLLLTDQWVGFRHPFKMEGKFSK